MKNMKMEMERFKHLPCDMVREFLLRNITAILGIYSCKVSSYNTMECWKRQTFGLVGWQITWTWYASYHISSYTHAHTQVGLC